jgi:hypothetical protein
MDTTLAIKRAIVFGISAAVGFVATMAIVLGPMETDVETYSYTYFVLTWIPISATVMIWGDVLMGTKILKD